MSHADPGIPELFDLSGSTAIVTGATGHLGGALASALAEAGARIVVTSRSGDRARDLAETLPTVSGGHHVGVALDHMDADSIDRAFDRAVELTDGVDILVDNACEPTRSDLSDVTAEAFTRQLANATGYFLLARRLRDHVVARRRPGSIILLGSMYGVVGSYPDAYDSIGPASPVAYQALKGGLLQMARHLAVYWAPDGVRVNCLSPGPFPGPTAPSELVERLSAKSPMGRIGSPAELKGAVLLLASRAGSYITGHNLMVDGGWTAW